MNTPLGMLYRPYASALFVLLGILALLGVLCLPTLPARRAYTRWVAHTALWLCGMRLTVRDAHALPQPCVVVANHESYLDGIVLSAALPPHFGFVIKREMARVPMVGMLLRRIGSHFVDRHNQARGAVDARRILRRATAGDALVFFPEGTFAREPGLLRFHTGAFAIAQRATLPVVPVAIQGTRACLPPGSLRIAPGRIVVEVLASIEAAPAGPDGAAWLRDTARGRLQERLEAAYRVRAA